MNAQRTRQGVRLLVLLGMACGSGLAAPGAARAHSEEGAVCIRTYDAIEIDGRLEDWVRRLQRSNWSAKLEITKGQVIDWMRAAPIYLNQWTSRIEAGQVDDMFDLSARIYLLWDPQRLYVAAAVTDNEVVTQHEGENIWQDDVVELWIDCRHDAVTHTLFQDDEYQVGFSPASRHRAKPVAWAWRNPEAAKVTERLEISSVLAADGYLVEASVPWAELRGCQPGVGKVVGFNISIVDKDEDQQWTHVTWSGQLHSDPSQFGHLFYVDAPIDLFPDDVLELETGQSPWGGPTDAEADTPLADQLTGPADEPPQDNTTTPIAE